MEMSNVMAMNMVDNLTRILVRDDLITNREKDALDIVLNMAVKFYKNGGRV